MKKNHAMIISLGMSALFVTLLTTNASACTTVLVGKKATTDGSILIARNEDGKTSWPKRFIANTPPKAHKYVSAGNKFTIDLPDTDLSYTSTPDPDSSQGTFGESGVNSANIAMSATESVDVNSKALKYDPFVKDGIAEDSMLDVILPYIHSAKEGVQRLGQIVEQKGAAEGDGIIFSDNNEAWYFEIGSGHNWAAEKVPDDMYAVIPNQIMLGNIYFKNSDSFMFSKSLPNFVKKHSLPGYHDGKVNFSKAFGTSGKINERYDGARQWDGQRILSPKEKQKIGKSRYKLWMKPDEKIDVKSVQNVLSSHFDNTQYDSYGKSKGNYRPIGIPSTIESHIIQMRPWIKTKNSTIEWLAMASPETSVYIPFYVNGITNTPKDYQTVDLSGTKGAAYWTYNLTRVLAENDHNKLVKDIINPQKNELLKKYEKNISDTDLKIDSLTDSNEIIDKMDAFNNMNADLAKDTFVKVNADLAKRLDKQDKVSENLRKSLDKNL